MSPIVVTILLFSALLLILFAGLPIVFTIGSISMIAMVILWGPGSLYVAAGSAWGTMNNFVLIAVPLFIFMGYVLQSSGIAEDLYAVMYAWFGPLRGGLAIGTVAICAIFAAMAGISGAATVSMGLIALPAMLKRNYDSDLALGSIAAGGSLGIVIPPSLVMIVYCSVVPLSVGKYFAAGVGPGILLAGLFMCYIGIRCLIDKDLCPAIPPEERKTWGEKFRLLKSVLFPIVIILVVLGSVWSGIATPTEAAGLGAFACLVAAALHRRLSWPVLREALDGSLRVTCMALWIVIAALCFRSVYAASGAVDVVSTLLASPTNSYVTLIISQLILLFLGFFLEPIAIVMLGVPIFWPVMDAIGVNQLWFAALLVMNLNLAYITPPVGFNLFFLGGIVPDSISMKDIYRSIIPFVFLNLLGIALVIIFPQIALWLPHLLYG